MTNHRLSLGPTSRQMAERLAAELETCSKPRAEALSVFEVDESGSHWLVDAYYGTAEDARSGAILAIANGLAPRAIALNAEVAEDWVSRSLKKLMPVQAGRFFVHGSHDRALRPANLTSIEIEAATAFGTGHHGTTRGCLLALDHVLRTGTPKRMIDIGSGSGILAIAYAKETRRPAWACDIDPEAVRLTRRHAQLNGTKVHAVLGEASNRMFTAGKFDLVMSNILARPLATLAPTVSRLSADRAWLVLSGLIAEQRPWIEHVYRRWGFFPHRRLELEGWCTLVLRRIVRCLTFFPRRDREYRSATRRYRPKAGRPRPRAG
jgi:ribosomal protein L11 methyltransferase